MVTLIIETTLSLLKLVLKANSTWISRRLRLYVISKVNNRSFF